MQGTQYATKRSILCRGAFCGPTGVVAEAPLIGYRRSATTSPQNRDQRGSSVAEA